MTDTVVKTEETAEATAAAPVAKKGPRVLTEKELEARREVPWMLIPKTIWDFTVKYGYEKPLKGVQWLGRKVDDIGRSPILRSGYQAILGLPVGIIIRNTGRSMYHMSNGDYARSHWLGNVAGGIAGYGAAVVGLAGLGGVTSVAGIASGGLLATAGHVLVVAAAAAVAIPVIPVAAMVGAVALTAVVTAVTAGFSIFPAIIPNSLVGALRTKDAFQGIKGVDYDGAKEKKKLDYDSIREIEERKMYSDVSWKVSSLNEAHQKEIFDRLSERFGKAAAKDAANDDAQVAVAHPAAKGVTVTPTP